MRGFSSDYAAILDSITTKLGITREKLADYRVAIIGAGGTGRTAVAALAHYGATVVVYNRTFDRAKALADEFNGKSGRVVAAKMEKLCDSCCQIYLNTTSIGMHPNTDQSPIDGMRMKWSSETLAFDAIYNPMETKFLRQATEAGAKPSAASKCSSGKPRCNLKHGRGKRRRLMSLRNVVVAALVLMRHHPAPGNFADYLTDSPLGTSIHRGKRSASHGIRPSPLRSHFRNHAFRSRAENGEGKAGVRRREVKPRRDRRQ